ncbi:MAG TPA: hypothetical protein VH206_03300 [Xanthobacteraceae bacterium]|jgi:hypothetical protein|nr:hypothetical protein [Xanthobacteraceae bacterium]
MRIGAAHIVMIAAIGVAGLSGCSAFSKLDESAAADNLTAPETTGSITPRPATPALAPEPKHDQVAEFWGIAY